jgi:hypothetical protein
MSKSRTAYRSVLSLDNDLELYEQFVHLHCVSKLISKQISKIPRKQLLTLLALYLKYDYSKETKLKALHILGIDNASTLNSFNFELTELGFLTSDIVSTRVKHLNKSLKVIQQYIQNNISEEVDFAFLFTLKVGE